MSPALECKECGKRFKTPNAVKATPGELERLINMAYSHAVAEGSGSSLINHVYWMEPYTGQTETGVEVRLTISATKK